MCVPSYHPQFVKKKKKKKNTHKILSLILIIDWVFTVFIDKDPIFVQLSKHCFL